MYMYMYMQLTYPGIAMLANSMTPFGCAATSVDPSPDPVVEEFWVAAEGPW